LFQPFQATQEQLAGATSAGQTFGRVLVGAFQLITWPIRTNIKLMVMLGQKIGEVAGWVGGLWDGLQAKVGAVVDWIAAKIGWFVQKWNTLKALPGNVWGDIKNAGASIGNTVGDVFRGGGGPVPAMAGGRAMPAMATRGGYTDSSTHTTSITVQATPGMDEKALARHVREQLDERDRANAARQRSRLGDLE